MNRRDLMTLIGGAATWPVAARAQQPMPVIGLLSSETPNEYEYLVTAFRQGLNESGYVEGRNVAIEYRWAEGDYDRLPVLAGDLARRQVNVIAALGAPATLPAKAATSTIPIVFLTGDDAVKAGLVESFNRPNGNMTGVSLINVALTAKRLELLRELVPRADVIAVLVNAKNPSAQSSAKDALDAAHALGQHVETFSASTADDFDGVFAKIDTLQAGALLLTADAFFIRQCSRLAALAMHHMIPAIHIVREFARAGGLISYGPSLTDEWRQVGNYTGRILKGAKPADLPVQQPTKFELVINLKTAKALDLSVPASLIAIADEVIE